MENLNQLLVILYSALIVLAIAIVIFLIVFLFWNAVLYPLKQKDEMDRKLDEQRKELEKLYVLKGQEFDNWKELQDEIDKTNKQLSEAQKRIRILEKRNAELEVQNSELESKTKVILKENKKKNDT